MALHSKTDVVQHAHNQLITVSIVSAVCSVYGLAAAQMYVLAVPERSDYVSDEREGQGAPIPFSIETVFVHSFRPYRQIENCMYLICAD